MDDSCVALHVIATLSTFQLVLGAMQHVARQLGQVADEVAVAVDAEHAELLQVGCLLYDVILFELDAIDGTNVRALTVARTAQLVSAWQSHGRRRRDAARAAHAAARQRVDEGNPPPLEEVPEARQDVLRAFHVGTSAPVEKQQGSRNKTTNGQQPPLLFSAACRIPEIKDAAVGRERERALPSLAVNPIGWRAFLSSFLRMRLLSAPFFHSPSLFPQLVCLLSGRGISTKGLDIVRRAQRTKSRAMRSATRRRLRQPVSWFCTL